MMKAVISKAIRRENLSVEEASGAMSIIMEGSATPAQIAAFAVALHMKGETADEITGFAQVMRDFSIKVPTTGDKVLVDTCGTGGDSLKTFNISTTAALIVASSRQVAVAKHGNRAATSKCGSADVLEALGVRLDLPPADVARCIDEVGIGFLYAPAMHPALKYASVPRSEIGVRTFFNILGPLTNPAGASVQLIGVNDPSLCDLLAKVLLKLGSERCMMVHGLDGLDEISTVGETLIVELKDRKITRQAFRASDIGIKEVSVDELAAGNSPEENAKIVQSILEGSDAGPRRDIVCLNAAAVLMVAGIVDDLQTGYAKAVELVSSGAALNTLECLKNYTNL
jgi:anthranilate phosphoribosyltransferase